MPNEMIKADGSPEQTGPYSPAVLATGSRVLAVSGQVAEGPDGKFVGGDNAGEQARQCLANIDALLSAGGASKTDVVQIGVYLTDMADRAAVAEARIEYFGDHKPAATLFAVAGLVAPELKVEIEVTAIF